MSGDIFLAGGWDLLGVGMCLPGFKSSLGTTSKACLFWRREKGQSSLDPDSTSGNQGTHVLAPNMMSVLGSPSLFS